GALARQGEGLVAEGGERREGSAEARPQEQAGVGAAGPPGEQRREGAQEKAPRDVDPQGAVGGRGRPAPGPPPGPEGAGVGAQDGAQGDQEVGAHLPSLGLARGPLGVRYGFARGSLRGEPADGPAAVSRPTGGTGPGPSPPPPSSPGSPGRGRRSAPGRPGGS